MNLRSQLRLKEPTGRKAKAFLLLDWPWAAVVSLPVFAVYTIKFAMILAAVREFRLRPSCSRPFPWGFSFFYASTWRIVTEHGFSPAQSNPLKSAAAPGAAGSD